MYEMNRGLPLITYAPRGGGGGGVSTDAYKCVHFVCRFIENGTIYETFKDRQVKCPWLCG